MSGIVTFLVFCLDVYLECLDNVSSARPATRPAQLHAAPVGYNGIVADPVLDANETAYADALADTTRGLVAALPAKKVSDPKSSVFSIACYSHHASEKAKFADERALDSNASQADALFMFLQPSVTTSLKYVDGGAGGFATC